MIDSIETMKRNKGVVLLAALLSGAGLLMYAVPLAGLFRAAFRDETFSYIVFIPPVSLYLIYEERKRIFAAEYGSLLPGVVLVVPRGSSVPGRRERIRSVRRSLSSGSVCMPCPRSCFCAGSSG